MQSLNLYSSHIPGLPENRAKAGTTVFGGKMVLSVILAQSFMIANLPLKKIQKH